MDCPPKNVAVVERWPSSGADRFLRFHCNSFYRASYPYTTSVTVEYNYDNYFSKLILPFLQVTLAVFTLETDYPSETGYSLDNSRQADNTP